MNKWKESQLMEVGNVISGGTPSTDNPDFWGGEILFVTPFDLSRAKTAFIENSERKISKEGLINSSANLLPIDSIIISSRAPIGYIAIAKKEFTTNQGCKSIVPNSNFDSTFLYFCLDFYVERIKRLGAGSTFAEISKSDLESVKIYHPTELSEQRRIAKILSTCDAVIGQTEATIAKYKAIKQGMLHDLFTRGIDTQTGQLRPSVDDAPHLYKDSKLGKIPIEWEVLAIKEIIEPIMSNVDKHIKDDETRITLCNYMDVYNNRYLTTDISFSEGSVTSSEILKFSLRYQDVVITKDSETPEDIAVPTLVYSNFENLICGYHLCILRSKSQEKLQGEFLMLQLQHPEINKQFAIRANGSTRYGLTLNGIENISLKIPKNIDEQKEVSKRLQKITQKLETEQQYLKKLLQLKSGMMNDLLSGRKRVGEW